MIPAEVIARPLRAARFLRHRWYWVIGFLALAVPACILVRSTLNDSSERVKNRQQLVALAVKIQEQTSQLQAQNVTVQAQGATVLQIAQAIADATGPDAQAKSAASVIDVLKRNALSAGIEADCRSRRQQVRLPAPPDPTRPCVDQTPADVYPGVDGQPSKGP